MSATLDQGTVSKPPRTSVSQGFIIGPVADSLLIIGSPVLALILGSILFTLPNDYFNITIHSKQHDMRQVMIASFINAHLFLVYFRSHANQNIFRMYPWRFIAVPIAVFLIGATSSVALAMMAVVSVWWDVYHSSLQTFGFGRIYDSKMKNDASVGRRLDYWMNLFVYLGPVLAGVHFVDHLNLSRDHMGAFAVEKGVLNELFLQRTPDYLQQHQSTTAIIVLAVGVPFLLYYIFAYYQFQQQGYRVSWQKVWLLVITSCVSIYCWGFCRFIDAFWVMNFFHALQYFAIVSYSEKKNLTQLFQLNRFTFGTQMAVIWVVSFCMLYGLWSAQFVSDDWSLSLIVTTSLMHFWYDGFIWSVKKKQV